MEFLTTRIATLLRDKGPMSARTVAPILETTVRKAHQAMKNMAAKGYLAHEPQRNPKYHFIMMPLSSNKAGLIGKLAAETGQKRKRSGSGVVAAPRLPPDPARTLRRDILAAWRLCQRDPVETTQSAVFRNVR